MNLKKMFLFFMFLVLTSTSTNAAAVDKKIEKNESYLRVHAACPYGDGICRAFSRGVASVRVNGKQVFVGACYQCLNCDTVYVGQYDPYDNVYVGKFVSKAWTGNINYWGAIVNVYPDEITEVSNKYTQLLGIEWKLY